MKTTILLLALGLTLTACGAAPTTPSATPDGELAFARCMRGEGVKIDDPSDGHFKVDSDIAEKQKMDAAMAKCGHLLPGGKGGKTSPEDLEKSRKQARCMRANGFPKFPDPDSSGRIRLDVGAIGTNPDDPKFKAAMEKCRTA